MYRELFTIQRGPLSDFRIPGMPCRANIAFAEVVVRISTSGYRLYSSITTNRHSPEGNGRMKSTATLRQAFSGSLDGCSGSGGGTVVLVLTLDRVNTSRFWFRPFCQ